MNGSTTGGDSGNFVRFRRALHKRRRCVSMSWKEYVTREIDNNVRKNGGIDPELVSCDREGLDMTALTALLELRVSLINTIKRSAKSFSSSMCRSPAVPLKPLKVNDSRLHRIESNVANRCNMVCFSSTKAPSPERNHGVTNIRDIFKSFVLDVGSRHATSDADITVMNVMCVDVIDHIIKDVNLAFSDVFMKEFDVADLEELFDIHLFINSFLVSLRGNLCYVDFDNLSVRTKRMQRVYSKIRVTEFMKSSGVFKGDKKRLVLMGCSEDINAEITRAQVDGLLREKMRSFFSGDIDQFVHTTSNIAMISSSESYFTQGAFLHVLVEIQSGVNLSLTMNEYLDSAFENLGMLTDSLNKSSAHNIDSAINKYISRLVHALGRFVERVECTTSAEKENIRKRSNEKTQSLQILNDLVYYLDQNTIHDEKISPRVSCSTGRLSRRIGRKNTAHVTFRSVVTFDGINKSQEEKNVNRANNHCSYYVPFRRPCHESPTNIVFRTYQALSKIESIERRLGSRMLKTC